MTHHTFITERSNIYVEDTLFVNGEKLTVYRISDDKGILLSDLKWYSRESLVIPHDKMHADITEKAVLVLHKVINRLEQGRYSDIEKMLGDSPSGDGHGEDNSYIFFEQGDIQDVLNTLKTLGPHHTKHSTKSTSEKLYKDLSGYFFKDIAQNMDGDYDAMTKPAFTLSGIWTRCSLSAQEYSRLKEV